jgi:hypothetical protein
MTASAPDQGDVTSMTSPTTIPTPISGDPRRLGDAESLRIVERTAAADAIDTARHDLICAMKALDHLGDEGEAHRCVGLAVASLDDARTAMAR